MWRKHTHSSLKWPTSLKTAVPESTIYAIGVNIRERKNGTERMKRRKKRELVMMSTAMGATGTVVYNVQTLHGFCPSYDNQGYLYPGRAGPTRLTNRQNT